MPRDEIARLKYGIFSSDDNLLNLGMAVLGPQQSTLDVCIKDFQLAKDLDLIISMHIGGKFLTPNGFDVLRDLNLLNKKTNIVQIDPSYQVSFSILDRPHAYFYLSFSYYLRVKSRD